MQNFDEALQDFRAVLEVDADNKAAKNQLAITSHKIKQIHNREKQTYAGMFQKFAEIDAKVSDSDRVIIQSLSGQAPLHLANDWRLVSDSTRRSLRSADVSTCVVPPALSSYGDRTSASTFGTSPVELSSSPAA